MSSPDDSLARPGWKPQTLSATSPWWACYECSGVLGGSYASEPIGTQPNSIYPNRSGITDVSSPTELGSSAGLGNNFAYLAPVIADRHSKYMTIRPESSGKGGAASVCSPNSQGYLPTCVPTDTLSGTGSAASFCL